MLSSPGLQPKPLSWPPLPTQRRPRRTEQEHLPQEEVQEVLQQLGTFSHTHTEFLKFLEVVKEDIKDKSEQWDMVKKSETGLGKDIQKYAAIQMFMLRKFTRRMSKYERVLEVSVQRICLAHRNGDPVEELVARHHKVLLKLKRRLKHMLDVSDKYYIMDLASSPGSSPSTGSSSSYFSWSNSSLSLDSTWGSAISLSSPSCSSSPSLSPLPSLLGPPDSASSPPGSRLRPLSSLLDQLLVLGRSYTHTGQQQRMRITSLRRRSSSV